MTARIQYRRLSLDYTEMDAARPVGTSLVLTDDGANLKGATVRIASGFTPGDILAVATPGSLTAATTLPQAC